MKLLRLHLAMIALILLCACPRRSPVQPKPPETFEEMLLRTEGVTCATITYHDYGDTPSCREIYDAWVRGRNRVVRVYPQAADIRMSALSFYRPRLITTPEVPYPLIADVPGNPRGVTYVLGGLQIVYSYEQVVEHEATHALVFLTDGFKVRTPADIAADPCGYNPGDFQILPFYFYLITCHGTPDDPFGEPGRRGSCAMPYTGQVALGK